MKELLFFLLIGIPNFIISSNSIINKNFIFSLKQKNLPYEVYEPEENPFNNWTDDEIKSILTIPLTENQPELKTKNPPNINEDLPESYDFRLEHPECVTPVRDQEKCGSCWAFGGTMAFQERLCLKSEGKLKVVLSTQDSVSCNHQCSGCDGCTLPFTWAYFEEKGLVTEECFPYTSGDQTVEECPKQCKNGDQFIKYKIKDYYKVSKDAIKAELIENGPVNTSFLIFRDFMNYKGGIYIKADEEMLGSHAVVIVGYGEEDGVEYWICKNSWGPTWGEEGYFRIKIGECSIGSNAYAGTPIVN